MDSLTLRAKSPRPVSHVYPNGFTYPSTLLTCGDQFRWFRLSYPPASPHRITVWYRNIDLFPIDYAFRPRLRDRLTLSGRTFLRKP